MKEPLMSTPMNMTSRGAGASGALAGPFAKLPRCLIESLEQLVDSSATVRIAIRSSRMSGHLLVGGIGRVAQLALQRAGVLEVLDAVEREVQQVPVRAQHRDEVERGRDHLHGRHEERIQQLLALVAGPLELGPELVAEAVREQPELLRRVAVGVRFDDSLARDDGKDRGRAGV